MQPGVGGGGGCSQGKRLSCGDDSGLKVAGEDQMVSERESVDFPTYLEDRGPSSQKS